jgi:DNA-binding GntR family transcriptional regulator
VIVAGSGNETLLEIWSSLHVESRTVITLVKERPDLHAVAEMHRPIIDAFGSESPSRCARAVRKHIEHFAKWVPAELDADSDADSGSGVADAAAPPSAAARSRRTAA